jgi:translation initiation factor 3 subunit H
VHVSNAHHTRACHVITRHVQALRLTDTFMDVYRNTDFTSAQIAEKALPWNEIFQEIPVTVTNSALVSAVLGLCASGAPASQGDFDQLGLSTNPFLEKNLEFLNECMDDLGSESQKVAYHSRAVARQQAQQAAWVQKRRAENATRRSSGQEPLPEEEPGNPLFKPLPEPSRLDGFLIVNQVANYCAQIDQFGTKSVQKLFLMEGLADVSPQSGR